MMVEFETGETNTKSLSIIVSDYPYTCFMYAEENNFYYRREGNDSDW